MSTNYRYLVPAHKSDGLTLANGTLIPGENLMTYAETVLLEFDQEMANIRKVLERIPDDKSDWQPHPKSHTIGWNANHLANLPDWLVHTLTKPSLDIAPVGGEPYKFPTLASRPEILESSDRNVATAKD
jgi:hypothetical protein